MKTAPPKGFGSRSCEGLAVIGTRIVEFCSCGAHPKSVKTLIFFWRLPVFGRKNCLNFWFRLENLSEFQWRPFFLFWRSPVFGLKTRLNFSEDFFFQRWPVFGRKKRLNFWFRPENLSKFPWTPFFFRKWPVFGLKKRLNFWFWPENLSEFQWTPFYFFRDDLFSAEKSDWISDFGQKIYLNFNEHPFFFWRWPVFGRKKRLNFWFRPENLSEFQWTPFFFSEMTCFWPEKAIELLISARKSI